MRGVVPGSEAKAPLSIRPNVKAWTSTWSPSPATDSTWHVDAIADEEDTAAELGGRPAFPESASDRGADCRRKGPDNG